MSYQDRHGHPSAERLQAFLDGELPRGEHAGLEEHVAGCARCSAELDAWRVLYADLDGLGSLRPHEGFAERVMAGVRVPEPVPLAARIRNRLAALVPASAEAHVGGDRLQDFVEGLLPDRVTARVEAHLGACASCAAEAEAWRAVLGRLDGLERFAPEEAFAERVMAGVAIPRPARVSVAVPAWRQLLAWGGRLAPRTRRAWAALSGMAVTPAVTAGLVFYAVFSHPTLTPGALVSFAWWQVTDLAVAGWSALATFALESAQLFGLYSLFELVAAAPLLLAAGVSIYTVACGLAARVLYKNLFSTRPVEARYAQLSVS